MVPMHLLVLERDPVRRDALIGVLRAAGHHAVAAPDPWAAAAAIGQPGFDALVLDLGLPELDPARLREALVPAEAAAPGTLDAAERRHIALALRHTGGNKRQAALVLGISRSTLLHKVRKYGLAAARVVAVALVLLAQPTASRAQETAVPPGRVKSGTLSFDGHGTPGDFIGRTSTVSGEMTGASDLAGVRGWVEAPERTGAGTSDSVPVMLEGALTIHGVSRDVALPGYVRAEGGALRVRTDFPLNLKDYRIGGLSKLLGALKMDEHIEVHVDLTFAPAA
jgi:CheY-like chemotaxis protein